MQRFVHTPEGVRDIYGMECARKQRLQAAIHENFMRFGYEDIETPAFEFFDVFGREIGTTPSKELYKFFDKEGNTLALRPDFTPSIGRCAAKYFTEQSVPVRLAYMGNTYTNTSNLQGKLKEVTQMGVEMIGDSSVMADAEMIHLAVSSLKASGLKEFQVSIGEIGFFKGICEEAELDEDTEMNLREFISAKNYFGAEELLSERCHLKPSKIETFLKITELFGSFEVLEEALELVNNKRSSEAIIRLQQLYQLLKMYGDEDYVSFDLGLVSKYHYYTGIIFKGYTYGVGDAVVTGGRYDRLLSYFGKDAAAIGFAVNIGSLMQALASKKLEQEVTPRTTMLLYEEDAIKEAIRYACEFRKLGECCELLKLPDEHDEKAYVELAKAGNKKAVMKITSKGMKKLYEV